MNTMIFEVYKNTLKKTDGFNPVSAENKYTEIKLKFKSGDDWEKCNIVTATFFGNSIDNTYSVAAETENLTAVVKIPAAVLRNNNKINFGVSGMYDGENEKITIATNVVTINVSKGIIINDFANAELYRQVLEIIKKSDALNKADKATTLAGYGIEDAYTKEETAINFIKNISGAVEEVNLSSMLLSKLSYVTPQMFKAPDDIDDTEAIQRAINTGKSVYIPKGEYCVRKIVISAYNGRVYGDGVYNTVIKHNDSYADNDCIIHITNNSSCILSSMSVVGGGYSIINNGSYSGANYNGVMITKCASSTKGSLNIIENIDVYNCLGSGIYLAGSELGACNGCRVSNAHTYNNVEYGLYNAGYGNKVINLDTHQNRLDGLKIDAGGFNATNIKSWGNNRDGVNMDNANSNIFCVVLSNISVQQNGRHGLIMNNCKSCVITGYQSFANNFRSLPYLAAGNPLEADTAGIYISDGNYNNYIQGNVTSGTYDFWKSLEECSVKISGKNNINNILDLSLTDSMQGSDNYDNCFNPIDYTDSSGNAYQIDDYTKLPEYKTLTQVYDNPLNSIRINGSIVNGSLMEDIKLKSATNSYLKKADGTDYISMTDNSADTPDILTISLSNYADLPVYTIDGIKQSGISNIDVAKIAYRRGYTLAVPASSYDVLYLRLTAKVSEYKAFGILPVVQISYKNESNKNVYEYADVSLKFSKSNVIFKTDYITKNIALDLSKYKGKDITLYPRLCVTRLSDDIKDTAAIDIKEFSYKLC